MSIFMEPGGLGWTLTVSCDHCQEKIAKAEEGIWGVAPVPLPYREKPIFVHTRCAEDYQKEYGGELLWFPGGLATFCLAFGTSLQVEWGQIAGVLSAIERFNEEQRGN